MAELSEEDRMFAAEFALGLLDGAFAQDAAARMRTDPDFAAEVRTWQEDLAGLAEELDPLDPSARARRALMARVFGDRRSPWRWALGALAGTALAALVLVVGVQQGAFGPVDPALTAELQAEGRDLRIAALYADGAVQLTRVGGEPAPAGRATELWAIAEGRAPVSLGLVPEASVWRAALPAELAAAPAGLVLALSDEPPGGSPTGQPTGAVLAAAPLQLAQASD
jgi:anti-sigma-K factor RskA